jgi:hypothetical protein
MEKFAPLNLTPDELIDYTPEWTGERFDDGRPKVPDAIIERMRNVTITQAWGVLRGEGYHHQFEGDFVPTHPGEVLVGRALTAMYMPRRPLMRDAHGGQGRAAGLRGRPDLVAHRHARAGRCLRGRCLRQDRGGRGHGRQPGHLDPGQLGQRRGA